MTLRTTPEPATIATESNPMKPSTPPSIQRHVAFLRGMNLGRRRITNDELCAAFANLGLANATAFMASGNVVFDAQVDGSDPGRCDEDLSGRIESGLATELGYPVPTFLRSAAEILSIAEHQPFDELEDRAGKFQVIFMTCEPDPAARSVVLTLATADDRLLLAGRELYWQPKAGLSDSPLDIKALERAGGITTIRTHRTVERIAARFLAN